MRRYGPWAGNPKGMPEDPARCIAEVAYGGRSVRFHQCSKKRGKGPHGLYCGTHARRLEAGFWVDVPQDGGPR